jgi:pimeloyl-ACP methyl ester carboxylesterase
MVDNLTYLMDELEIENAHLFGASIGNMIGQMMTGQHPTRVKSLSGYGIVSLLGDLSATKKNYEDRVSEIRKLGPLLLERINSNNFKEIVRNVYTRSIFGRPYQELSLKEKLIHKLLERRVFPMLEGTPVKSMELVFSYYIKSIDTEKKLYLENLKNIDKTIPILFLHGTADSITSLEAAKMILEYLPQAKFIEFEGYEHIAPALKKKEGKAIMEKYVSFLNSVS